MMQKRKDFNKVFWIGQQDQEEKNRAKVLLTANPLTVNTIFIARFYNCKSHRKDIERISHSDWVVSVIDPHSCHLPIKMNKHRDVNSVINNVIIVICLYFFVLTDFKQL